MSTAKKRQKQKLPTEEEVFEKKPLLSKAFEKEAKLAKSKKSPTTVFLKSISGELQKALDEGLSFVRISRSIETVYGVKINTATISVYAKTKLNYQKSKSLPETTCE